MRCFGSFFAVYFVFLGARPHAVADARAARRETTVIPDSPDGIQILLTPGTYTYRATSNEGKIAGIYFLAEADQLIRITFAEFDVPCGGGDGRAGSLVQYTDGWELNGQVFPMGSESGGADPADTEFCSGNPPGRRTFVSSQNGALIAYRIFEVGRGFTIHVEHRRHPSPCNVIYNEEPYVVLRNRGGRANCSYWFPDKLKVRLNSYGVGSFRAGGSSRECWNSADRIEIGGTDGLDPNRIEVLDSICNESKFHGRAEHPIDCAGTTVKLVSSGAYENYLNVSLRRIDPGESIADTKYRCSSAGYNYK